MKKLLNSSKWIYYALGLISAIIIISSLFFMTQYRFLRVNYIKETLVVENFYTDARTEIISDTKTKDEWLTSKTNKYPSVDKSWFEKIWNAAADDNQDAVKDLNNIPNVTVYDANAKLNNADQSYLFNFINQVVNKGYDKNDGEKAQKEYEENANIQIILEKDGEDYKYITYDEVDLGIVGKRKVYSISQTMFDKVANFRKSLDNYNNLILAYGIVSLIVFAAFIVLSNHNRKIYYKANLIGGIGLPLVNIVFSLILIIQGISLMSNISDPTNSAFYNVISALQNAKVGINYQYAATEDINLENAKTIISNFNINSTTIVIYVAFFALTALYNIFLIIFAFLKYKDTEQARNDVLEKARLAGEKA
jgi:hypothetical protein